jgi:hypothetical protein
MVCPDLWFSVAGSGPNPDQLCTRRFSSALHKLHHLHSLVLARDVHVSRYRGQIGVAQDGGQRHDVATGSLGKSRANVCRKS